MSAGGGDPASHRRPDRPHVEAPDNIGGFIRHYEVPEFIRVGAPLYVKLGLRNAPDTYPSRVSTGWPARRNSASTAALFKRLKSTLKIPGVSRMPRPALP